MKKISAVWVSVAAAASVAAGAATTAGATPPEDTVGYSVTSTPTATLISTDAGSLVNDAGVFKIKAADGTVLAGAELSFRVDDFVFPIAAEIRDRSATLTPQFDLAHAVYKPVALPFEN
ncbi:hypothetical protein ACWDTH_35405, partial [Nocardia xishanensis]